MQVQCFSQISLGLAFFSCRPRPPKKAWSIPLNCETPLVQKKGINHLAKTAKLQGLAACDVQNTKRQHMASAGDIFYINQPTLPTWHGKLRLKKLRSTNKRQQLKAFQCAPFDEFQYMAQAKISQHNSDNSAPHLHNFGLSMDPPHQTKIGAHGNG